MVRGAAGVRGRRRSVGPTLALPGRTVVAPRPAGVRTTEPDVPAWTILHPTTSARHDRATTQETLVHVLVIGGTSGTGAALVDQLLHAGEQVRVLARDPEKAAPLVDRGVEVVAGDLTADGVHEAVEGVDAVAFCAGSGSSTGKDQTLLVDLHGALRTIDAATALGARRYLMLSSIAAADPLQFGADAGIASYLAAKHAADRVLAASELDWTILRPGGLTDDPPTGALHVRQPRIPDAELGDRSISRVDVAATMLACLRDDTSIGATFEFIRGEVPIEQAVRDLHPLGPNA
ncbi:SDR family oxidoreductase [Nitriliruptoraceae bacterium ZYF776]|nr:SDR family oxidoreductase [Profundirhabdus halotolerans]